MRSALLTLLLLAFPCVANATDTQFSIVRPLGYGGSFGRQILSMTCAGSSSPCQIRRLVKGQVIETRTLSHGEGIQIASRLLNELKNTKIIQSSEASQPPTMMWSLD